MSLARKLTIKNDKKKGESYSNGYAKCFKKMKTDFGKGRRNKFETLISFSKGFPDTLPER